MAQDYLDKVKRRLKQKRREGDYPDLPAPQDKHEPSIELGMEEPTFADSAGMDAAIARDEDARSPMDQLRQAIRDTDRSTVPKIDTAQSPSPKDDARSPMDQLRQAIRDTDRSIPRSAPIPAPDENPEPDAMQMPARAWVERANKMTQPVAQVDESGLAANAGRAAKTAAEQMEPTPDDEQGPDIEPAAPLDVSTDFQPLADKAPQVHPDDPPESSLPNKDLGAGINATSAATSTEDVAKAMERPHGVKDESAYWAALKGIALAFQPDNQAAGGFYDAKIHENQQALANYQGELKDWRTQTAAALKQKYDESQRTLDRNEKIREFGIKEQENANKAEELKQYRDAQLAAGREARKGIKDRFDQKQIDAFMKENPSVRSIQSFNNIAKRLEDATPIQGWDEANVAAAMGDVNGVMQIFGKPFEILSHNMRKGTEAEGIMTDLMSIFQDITVKTTGKQVNESELRRLQTRLGIAAGQSQAAFRRAFREELKALQGEVGRNFDALSPEVKEMAKERGLLPEWDTSRATPYAPHVNWKSPAEVVKDKTGINPGPPPQQTRKPFDDSRIEDIWERNSKPAIAAAQGAPPIPTNIPVREPDGSVAPVPNASDLMPGLQAAERFKKTKLYNWAVRNWGTEEAKARAKAMEDEDARRQARKDAGLD